MADKYVGTHLLVKTHKTDEAIAANRFVKLVTATGAQPHVVYADGGDPAVGVSRDGYASGEYADIVKIGEAWVEVGGSNIAVGQPIQADTDGKAEVATTADIVLGTAQTDANAGEFVLVLLGQGGIF